MAAPLLALACPHCGAPLHPRFGGEAVCSYCGRSLTGVPEASWGALLGSLEDVDDLEDGRVSCRVAGQRFVLRGLLGRGARSSVFLAERGRPVELVVLKVRSGRSDQGSPAREWKVLTHLARVDAEGGALFSRETSERPALVYRWQSGFSHTLRGVAAAYPDGVDARTAVWMWRRILGVLGWVHGSGVVHGAVTADHVLIHPRDHRALLVGWGAASDDVPPPGDDLKSSASCIRGVFGRGAVDAPRALIELLAETERGAIGGLDAASLSREVARVAEEAFGPPKFHPFTMPVSR